MVAIARTIVAVKPGSWDAMVEFGKAQESLVSKIPGIHGWGWAETAQNELTLIVVYKDRAAAEQAAPLAGSIFEKMADLVAAPPERLMFSGEWFTP